MGKLKAEFNAKRNKFMPVLHQRSKKYNIERKNIVLRFLEFCESKNISQIRDIRERHYTEYLKVLSQSLAPQTVLKHKKVLRLFFDNADLDITVNTAKHLERYAEKVSKRVLKFLDEDNLSFESIEQAVRKAILGGRYGN